MSESVARPVSKITGDLKPFFRSVLTASSRRYRSIPRLGLEHRPVTFLTASFYCSDIEFLVEQKLLREGASELGIIVYKENLRLTITFTPVGLLAWRLRCSCNSLGCGSIAVPGISTLPATSVTPRVALPGWVRQSEANPR